MQKEYAILIVEDDVHTLELLTYNLTDAGYRVTTAKDGEQALETLWEQHFDLILCDVMMPRMNGFELREAILEEPSLRDIAFIFLTARSRAEDEIYGLQTGVDEYITKPFDLDVLLARVQAVLARRENFARMANVDSLTGLLNRHALESAVHRELNRIQRYPTVASMVFLDVDSFKRINDIYGHAIGDQVLIRLADIFRAQTRTVDIVGRFGGEEFLMFFPQTPQYEALAVVTRMQEHFHAPLKVLPNERLSFSAGLVEAPRDGTGYELLCSRADAAMYQAKRMGKDRIVSWNPELEMASDAPASS